MDEEKLLLWLPPFTLLLIVEFVFACLVFRLSEVISILLSGLIVFQLAAISLLFAKPEPPVSGELGGADLRPVFVFFYGFWGTVLVWAFSIIATTILYLRKRRRLSA